MVSQKPTFRYTPQSEEGDAHVQIGDRIFGTLPQDRSFYGHRLADKHDNRGSVKGRPLRFGTLGDLLTLAHGACLNRPNREAMKIYRSIPGDKLTPDEHEAFNIFSEIFSGRAYIGNTVLHRYGEEKLIFAIDHPTADEIEFPRILSKDYFIARLGSRKVGNVQLSDDGLVRAVSTAGFKGGMVSSWNALKNPDYLVLMTGIESAGEMFGEIIDSLNEGLNQDDRKNENYGYYLYPDSSSEEAEVCGLMLSEKILYIGNDDAGLSALRMAYGVLKDKDKEEDTR